MITRFQTRAFLFCFVPFAILLGSSFWTIQRAVESTVRNGLYASLRASQNAIAAIHAKGNLQNSRVLKVADADSALKSGIQLLVSKPHDEALRRSVESQLHSLGEQMGLDFMLVSAPNGSPLVGVVRESGSRLDSRGPLVTLDTGLLYHSDSGFRVLRGHTFQVASDPVSQNDANIGFLSVGRYFDLSDLKTPVVLIRDGKVIESNIPQVPPDELEHALANCKEQSECNLHLNGANWIALPIHSYDGGYELLSFENLDAATAPLQSQLRKLFLTLALSSVLVVFLCSIASSTSIVKPIAAVVSHLNNAAHTGVLTAMEDQSTSIREVRELAEIYNRAAISVRAASENLRSAYLEFVGSLANALDVRDGYTSGHSRRVSQLSCAVAAVLQLDPAEVERIRVGALLHDIGKIGISDVLLQKSGRLTSEEFEIVKQHPIIGRRILEGVQGFAPFLGAVELHHENWDGTGYPRGLVGEETPIDARIIHVADAYDAMTTNRSYRRGMSHKKALSILIKYAGTQFDPRIVEIFAHLPYDLLVDHANPSENSDNAEEHTPAAVA